jgi:hypothetical protein
MNQLTADVLVVGGGTGSTVSALQAARRGAKTILVSEFPWLGGMLTSAGVTAPDGNELAPFQTGLWGAFLRELQQRQPGGLDNAWVSFFTYDPRIGQQIFADWVQQTPNLHWIAGQTPLEVLKTGNVITGIRFAEYTIHAQIILDGTELGDILALAEIPHRWGWELQAEWNEPSAPTHSNLLTQQYPVQAPTWVVILQDYGTDAPEIPSSPLDDPTPFIGAWEGYTIQQFLDYGRLPGNCFMLNWPQNGNDYGKDLNRLIESESARHQYLQEARWHSQSFARFLQTQLGGRYGLAQSIFPELPNSLGGGAFALHPYYRESRRLQGLTTIREQDILPIPGGSVAPLPLDAEGNVTSIAIGNYPNDHHYPHFKFSVQPKSMRWGGRWTGTPFSIPYSALIPAHTDGLLVCEKNISVSHIANGATRLQPLVMGIGQAAGMAAALCIENNCQPRDLSVRLLQEALLQAPNAPQAVIPLLNLTPAHPEWLNWQRYYLDHPDAYPSTGDCLLSLTSCHSSAIPAQFQKNTESCSTMFTGTFHQHGCQDYTITLLKPETFIHQTWALVTLLPEVDHFLQTCCAGQTIQVWGRLNPAGKWLIVEKTIKEDFSG